jgi:hypothetical protein
MFNSRIFLAFMLFIKLVSAQAQNTDTWAIEYNLFDRFSSNAMLDLRYLNENTAGENGFIQRAADGRSFVDGQGKPIRFWATNGGDITRNMSDGDLARYARFLAKMGVNMIRYHGGVHPKSANAKLDEPDLSEINSIWRVVAAMKKEGIYTVISPFWPGFVDEMPAAWGLGQYQGKIQPWALMYFNDRMKNAYKKWLEVLYTRVNPYTNIALKDDPAVALIQIKNEDSVLFWTIQAVKDDLKALIEQKFHDWAKAKYTSIDEAYKAWDGVKISTDNPAAGRLGTYIIWEATQPQTGGKAKRVSDQVQFLAEHQRAFYTDIIQHIRGLGCKQLINASNWKTASTALLDDAERWSNAATDVMAVNRYYDPQHTGENNGWRIDPGHKFVGSSVLYSPEKFPINIRQIEDKPYLVTESGWNLPNQYQAEGPFLTAAYLSLTGVDGFFWFQLSTTGVDPSPYFSFTNFPGGQKAMHRWNASIPGQIMLMPANALLYRKGYVQEGKPVVEEGRSFASMWQRKLPLIAEEDSFDPNRDSWDNIGNPAQTELPPIAFLAGPVRVKHGLAQDEKKLAPELSGLLNLRSKTVNSITGQLKWDYKNGICTMDAPSAQGVTGFLKKGAPQVKLSAVQINSDNDYAAINVVAMDDKPLTSAEKILVQVGTTYRPTNWAETPDKVTIGSSQVDGFRVVNTGRMPWLAAKTRCTISINNQTVKAAYALDINGYLQKEIYVARTANGVSINVPENTMYLVLNTNTPQVTTSVRETGLSALINIFPNPSPGEITLELPSNIDFIKCLHVSNADGRRVRTFYNLSPGRNTFDLGNLPSGLYTAELLKENGKVAARKKIVVSGE